jgi:hypothetical protein
VLRGSGETGKAPYTHDLQPRAFLNLYKVAHSETIAVNGDNFASDTAPCRIWVDFVEEVGEQFEMNRPGHSKDADCEPLMVSGWLRAWHRYQLGQLSEVLGGCCEKELITRTIRPS